MMTMRKVVLSALQFCTFWEKALNLDTSSIIFSISSEFSMHVLCIF